MSCVPLPKIKWKIVDAKLHDSIESDYCIIAAEPMNVGPPDHDTPEQIAAKEKEFCLWVRLQSHYNGPSPTKTSPTTDFGL